MPPRHQRNSLTECKKIVRIWNMWFSESMVVYSMCTTNTGYDCIEDLYLWESWFTCIIHFNLVLSLDQFVVWFHFKPLAILPPGWHPTHKRTINYVNYSTMYILNGIPIRAIYICKHLIKIYSFMRNRNLGCFQSVLNWNIPNLGCLYWTIELAVHTFILHNFL